MDIKGGKTGQIIALSSLGVLGAAALFLHLNLVKIQ